MLLTPDDEAKLKDEFLSDQDEAFEATLTGQPRPNVLFEAGFAMGKRDDNVVLVSVGRLRPFSGISGRHVLRLDNSAAARRSLASRLRVAGLEVNDSGNDWLEEGDFTLNSRRGAAGRRRAR